MAALSAGADRASKGAGRVIEFPMADDAGNNIYKGAMVMADAAGYAVPGADTASTKFLGIAVETVLQAADPGAEGTNKVRLYTGGDFLFALGAKNAAITSHGEIMCMTDDNTVDVVGTTTNDIECGEISQWEDADTVWLRIDKYSCARVRTAAA